MKITKLLEVENSKRKITIVDDKEYKNIAIVSKFEFETFTTYEVNTPGIGIGFSTLEEALKFIEKYDFSNTLTKRILKGIEKINNQGFTILDINIGEMYKSKFLAIKYEITEEFKKENNLYYKERSLDILIKPGKNYEGLTYTDQAHTRKI